MTTLKEENKDLRISFESNGFIRSTKSMIPDEFISKWSDRIHSSLLSEFFADCESMNHSVDTNEMLADQPDPKLLWKIEGYTELVKIMEWGIKNNPIQVCSMATTFITKFPDHPLTKPFTAILKGETGPLVLLDQYAHGEPDKPKWIPVSERLPETFKGVLSKDVMTFTKDGDYEFSKYDTYSKYWITRFANVWKKATTITHWMPLPTPPKKG